MQQTIFIILGVIFLLSVLKQILFWSSLWQLKEYRFDRLRAHFYDTGIKSFFLALIGYYSLSRNKTPKFTAKAVMIGAFSFLFLFAILTEVVRDYLLRIYWAFSSFDQNIFLRLELSQNSVNASAAKALISNIASSLGEYEAIIGIMAVIFLIVPLIVSLSVLIVNIISGTIKKVTIYRARSKMSRFSNLKVIGITGSYGKSTTKEILADILSRSEKYFASGGSASGGKVLKTPANINTAIGIAQLILKELDEKIEIFIVEMGAYKRGEIREICEMVRPQIGIITAINEQHLALFGDIKNTIEAKFELVDSLPETGLAILNIGDANIQAGMENRGKQGYALKARVKLYSVGAKADVYAISEACGRQSVKFKYISGSNMKDFIVNITGCHNTSNALAAIIAAEDLGMDLDKIAQILQKVNYLDIALKNLAGPNGSTLVDDTYNANPDGVFAALNHIKIQRGRKIIIMSSLIELGGRARDIHQKLGKEISIIAAKVFFLDNFYISDIRKGAAMNNEADIEIRIEKNAKKLSEYLKNELKPSDTVLFINRGSRRVLKLLKE